MALYKFRIIIIIIIIIITNNSSLTPRLSFCYLYWRLHFWWHLTFFLIIPDSVQNVYRKIVFFGLVGCLWVFRAAEQLDTTSSIRHKRVCSRSFRLCSQHDKTIFVVFQYARMCFCIVMCPPVLCHMFCKFGFALDENNCQICKCNPNPCAVSPHIYFAFSHSWLYSFWSNHLRHSKVTHRSFRHA